MSNKSNDTFIENIALIVTLSLVLVGCAACIITFFGNILVFKAGL